MKIETSEGYVFKILAELLHNLLTSVCWEFHPHGITLKMMDNRQHVLIVVELDATNFNVYHVPETIYIAMNATSFYQIGFKHLKKKDMVKFSLDETGSQLCISACISDSHITREAYIPFISSQHLETTLPEGYQSSVLLISSQFQRDLKDMMGVNKDIIRIQGTPSSVIFSSGYPQTPSGYKRVMYGVESDAILFDEEFECQLLIRISKMTGLCKHLQCFVHEELPLLFRTHVGTLGMLSIYIKSMNQYNQY